MKILIGLVVILVVVWLVRSARKDTPLTGKRQPSANQPGPVNTHAKPTAMLQCQQCGLHLPTPDAVQGRLGAYCTEAHRQLAEN